MTLEIKFTDNLTFKYVHDLIMNHEGCDIEFIELPDISNLENLFLICHLLQYFESDKVGKIIYTTYRDELPTEELSPEMFFRGIPFDKMNLNGISYDYNDIIKNN